MTTRTTYSERCRQAAEQSRQRRLSSAPSPSSSQGPSAPIRQPLPVEDVALPIATSTPVEIGSKYDGTIEPFIDEICWETVGMGDNGLGRRDIGDPGGLRVSESSGPQDEQHEEPNEAGYSRDATEPDSSGESEDSGYTSAETASSSGSGSPAMIRSQRSGRHTVRLPNGKRLYAKRKLARVMTTRVCEKLRRVLFPECFRGDHLLVLGHVKAFSG
ncbi:hypothetical protein K432DRAFT_442924 [Lepidopterella palustris CBS 459.81]|uniref:Uncharacterized protein n=1 Tax=Lepidopterella palustris CBS 459.81 TaxID=1314670 RepID=A0A8E2EBH4_9PEZI|nr:hypothetical protein K432DRAFT_442924 [Lepidopterella palustris CBS 459.81]